MSDKYLAYTYCIGWKALKKFYYGVRWRNIIEKRHPKDDLIIHYQTSSNYVKEFIKENGMPDLVHVNRTFDNSEDARSYEKQMLCRLDVLNNDMWLNKTNRNLPTFKNKKHSKKSKNKMGKITIIDDVVFSSRAEAAEYYNVTPDTILNWLKTGKTSNKRKVIIDNTNFSSIIEAAKQLNVNRNTIARWAKKGRPTKESISKQRSEMNSKPVIIDGIRYSSMINAAKGLKISVSTIYRWVKEGKGHLIK